MPDTERTLTVLVGAGASFDCGAVAVNTNGPWKPPLVADLFANHGTFLEILKRYPRAELIAGEFRQKANQVPLEQMLRAAREEASPVVRALFREIPPYLQELLGTVGQAHIIHGPSAYGLLAVEVARCIPGRFDRVLYLSLNYDTLLDQALSTLYSHRFSSMQSYVWPEGCALVKLHGSVNWGYAIETSVQGNELAGYLTALAALEAEPGVNDERALEIIGGHSDRLRDGKLFYPAIAVPVQGKSGFVCPITHADYARAFVRKCTTFLVLGCQLLDQDVRDLFKPVERVERFKIVNGTKPAGAEVFQRLRDTSDAFRQASQSIDDHVHSEGFARFVQSGALKEFLHGAETP
jgi:hypothetical protein